MVTTTHLMPKSSSMPPGLWLAVRTMPPTATPPSRSRMTAETAGVDSRPARGRSGKGTGSGSGGKDEEEAHGGSGTRMQRRRRWYPRARPPHTQLQLVLTALADPQACHAVGGSDLDDDLDRLARPVPAVAAHDERRAVHLRLGQGVKNALHEVVQVVARHERLRLLAQARGAGLLALDRRGRHGVHGEQASRVVSLLQQDRDIGATADSC